MRSDFVGSFYEDATRGFDYQRCINWYPVFSDSGVSKNKLHLVGSPGSPVAVALTPNNGSGNRGMYETAAGRLFGVWGNTLYEFDAAETATDRNSSLRLSQISGNVSLSDNGIQMIIIDQGNGYIYTLATNAIVAITDTDFPTNANQVVYHDGYFVVSNPGTKRLYWSTDGIAWEALNFVSMVSAPDDITGLIRTNTDIWAFGEKTMEPYQNVGGTFTFERMPGATQSIGTRNPWTIAKIKDVVYFLASNKDGYGTVHRTNGYGPPEMISTEAINDKIATVGQTTDAIAYTYMEKGNYFYQLTIPTLNITFVYDATQGLWHEKAYWNSNKNIYERHRSTHHAFAFGKNYFGFNGDNNLYRYDSDYYLDNTSIIRRLRTGAHTNMENKNIKINLLELEFARGQGTVTGAGSNPKVVLRNSGDGGYTYGIAQPRDIGKIGQFAQRARWLSQGTKRDWVHEIVHAYPSKADIIDLYVDLEVLKS